MKILTNPQIQVKESDLNTIKFLFEVWDGDVKADLTGTDVRLTVKKPFGLTVIQDCVITDAVNGLCEIVLTNQAYAEVGNYTGELVITKDLDVTVTRSFEYSSLASIMDDATFQSTNDWQALHEIMLGNDLRPILGEGSPNTVITPEYIGQTYLDTLGLTMYFSTNLSNFGWLAFGSGGGGGEGGNDTLLGSSPPAIVPARIGQIFIDTVGKSAYISTGATSGDWEQVDGVGEVGPMGPEGSQGPAGPQGLQGIQGEVGSEGPQGLQGLQGIKGDTGPQGPQGDVGPQGLQGIQGIQGDIGPQGIQGDIGPEGPKGTDGTGVTILGSYSTEAELNAAHPSGNTNGDAYIVAGDLLVWNGALFENVGQIQGPQGIQGIQGPQGIQGETGLQGLKGDTGDIGPQGIQGLQGATGDTGPQGLQGLQGIQGDVGPQGLQGIQGEIGPKGDTGLTGDTGPQGPQGAKGDTGLQGIQGLTGDTGSQGIQGTQGIQGDTGPQGPQGLQGIQGEVGPQGPEGPVNVATTGILGGVKVGNGLRMGGTNSEWLTLRDGVGIKTNSVSLAVDVDKPTLDTWYAQTTQGLSIWQGTQADYDLIGTKDPLTLYFIVG